MNRSEFIKSLLAGAAVLAAPIPSFVEGCKSYRALPVFTDHFKPTGLVFKITEELWDDLVGEDGTHIHSINDLDKFCMSICGQPIKNVGHEGDDKEKGLLTVRTFAGQDNDAAQGESTMRIKHIEEILRVTER